MPLYDLEVLHLPIPLQEMICAIAELESDRKPLIMRYSKKTKETGLGILQVFEKTAAWLAGYKTISSFSPFQEDLKFIKKSYVPVLVNLYCRGQGYQAYNVDDNPDLLHKPFINVYFGAAYLKWLTDYQNKYDIYCP